MTDDELQRRLTQLRIPADDLLRAGRACEQAVAALDRVDRESHPALEAEPVWTWREWLWPSPLVWGGFATIWVIFAAKNLSPADSGRSSAPLVAEAEATFSLHSALLAQSQQQALYREWLQQPRTR